MTFNSEQRALAGGAVWVGYLAATLPQLHHESWAHALLVFAALVLVPLALDLVEERNDPPRAARAFRWAQRLQLPAGVLLAAACWFPPSPGAAGLALPWLAVVMLLALTGCWRVMRHGAERPLGRLVTDAALIFLFVGGLWIVADRAGLAPLGFDAAIVALTAVHFHYAGFALPLVTGVIARRQPDSRFIARVSVGVVLGVPAVAAGITATQLGAGEAFEAAAGLALALAGACVGGLHLRLALTEQALPGFARGLLGIAGTALIAAMVLAATYALRGSLSGAAWLGLPQMRAWHGTINAVGFALCAVLGWRLVLRSGA